MNSNIHWGWFMSVFIMSGIAGGFWFQSVWAGMFFFYVAALPIVWMRFYWKEKP